VNLPEHIDGTGTGLLGFTQTRETVLVQKRIDLGTEPTKGCRVIMSTSSLRPACRARALRCR
jgi:hypothetical protein